MYGDKMSNVIYCLISGSSEYDAHNESGNYVTNDSQPTTVDIPFNVQDEGPSLQQQKRWDLNYHEAARYLQVILQPESENSLLIR